MTLQQLIQSLQSLIDRGVDPDQKIYFGDKQQTCDYLVKNADGKWTIKEEWY